MNNLQSWLWIGPWRRRRRKLWHLKSCFLTEIFISFNPPWRAILKTLGRNWGMAHSNRARSVWSDQQRPQLHVSCVSAGRMKGEGNLIKYLLHLCSMHICCCNYLNKHWKWGALGLPVWTPGDLCTHVKPCSKYLQIIITAYAVIQLLKWQRKVQFISWHYLNSSLLKWGSVLPSCVTLWTAAVSCEQTVHCSVLFVSEWAQESFYWSYNSIYFESCLLRTRLATLLCVFSHATLTNCIDGAESILILWALICFQYKVIVPMIVTSYRRWNLSSAFDPNKELQIIRKWVVTRGKDWVCQSPNQVSTHKEHLKTSTTLSGESLVVKRQWHGKEMHYYVKGTAGGQDQIV